MIKSLIKKILPKKIIDKTLGRKLSHENYFEISNSLPSISCIDIGASYYPHPPWNIFLNSPMVDWYAIDPNALSLKYINEWKYCANAHPIQAGLSEFGGEKVLFRTNVDTGSSLLEPKMDKSFFHRIHSLDYFFPLSETKINTLSLQCVVDKFHISGPTFIKLDTQGTELSILRGAGKLFDEHRIVGVELESTMMAVPIMRGSGKFWEAAKFLESKNFELLHIHPIHFHSGLSKRRDGKHVVAECDMIFAIRRDIALKLEVEFQIALLAFYVTNKFYEEAVSLLRDSTKVFDWFKEREIAPDVLIKKLKNDV